MRRAHLKVASRECIFETDPADLSSRRLATAVDLRRAIGSLPEDHRAAVLLVCVEGFTYAEAAQVLEVPAGTVASRVARARQAMACLLRADSPKVVALDGRSRREGRE